VRTAALVVALALASSACGPRDTVDVGVKQAGVDILYGDQRDKTRPPPRPAQAELVPGFPALVSPPAGVFAPSGSPPPPPPPSPPVACPSASPFAVPEKPVTPYVLVAPAPGSYRFRQSGEAVVGATRVALPAQTVRRVENIVHDSPPAGSAGNFSYDMTETVGGITTTTTFRIDNDGTSPGVKLARRVVVDNGRTFVFDPTPDVLLMTVPTSGEAAAAHSVGVDPLTATTMSLDHRTVERVLVDACGTPLQAWRVEITNGQTMSAATGQDVAIKGVFDIAPQYGALILSESITLSGTDGSQAVSQTNQTIIDSITPMEAGR
jgi:hypothetical protein